MSGRTLDGRPSIEVAVVEDHSATARCDEGFLELRRLTLRNRYADGTESALYRYDLVTRDALDAVAIVLFAQTEGGLSVCLRSALRPPLAFRDDEPGPVEWEVPAGLIEPHERGEAGRRGCAAREALEEVGLEVPPEAFEVLGPAVYLSPGVMAERLHFLAARVRPEARGAPTEDGSPVEERAQIRFVPLERALEACRDGRIRDIKTETAIRRLTELAWGE